MDATQRILPSCGWAALAPGQTAWEEGLEGTPSAIVMTNAPVRLSAWSRGKPHWGRGHRSAVFETEAASS